MSHKLTVERYRLCFLGAGGVGAKTALILQYIQNYFMQKFDPTIEDSYLKAVEIDGQACLLDIMDTAGQEEYSALRNQYLKLSEAFAVGYSVTSRASFGYVNRLIEDVIRAQGKPINEIPMVIVGNKVDLVKEMEVSIEEGEKLAEKYGVPFLATSAKTRQNVDEVFITLVKEANRCRANSPIYSVIQMISHKQPISEIKQQMAKCSQLYNPQQISRLLDTYAYDSFLEVAIWRGSFECIQFYLDDQLQSSKKKDRKYVLGKALWHAANAGRPSAVRYLLYHCGAKTKSADSLRTTARTGHLQCLHLLLTELKQIDINDKISDAFGGETALHLAVRNGHQACALMLLGHGADPSITDAKGIPAAVEIEKRMPDLLPFVINSMASLQLLSLKTVLANLWMWDMDHLQKSLPQELLALLRGSSNELDDEKEEDQLEQQRETTEKDNKKKNNNKRNHLCIQRKLNR
jgi:small GTP-binding protein